MERQGEDHKFFRMTMRIGSLVGDTYSSHNILMINKNELMFLIFLLDKKSVLLHVKNEALINIIKLQLKFSLSNY